MMAEQESTVIEMSTPSLEVAYAEISMSAPRQLLRMLNVASSLFMGSIFFPSN